MSKRNSGPIPPAGQRSTNPKDGATLIYIPSGSIMTRDRDNTPYLPRPFDGFWIYETPVTVAQFHAYCLTKSYPYDWGVNKPTEGWKDDHPMVNITLEQATDYAYWAGADLPYSIGWEQAAYGDGDNLFSWGSEWDGSKCANSVSPNLLQGSVSVGSYPQGATSYGVLDMTGNVWEWCQDCYDDTEYDDLDKYGMYLRERILKGGSWASSEEQVFQSAYRSCCNPKSHSEEIGFRCVLSAYNYAGVSVITSD